jgi:hypothetical protein
VKNLEDQYSESSSTMVSILKNEVSTCTYPKADNQREPNYIEDQRLQIK